MKLKLFARNSCKMQILNLILTNLLIITFVSCQTNKNELCLNDDVILNGILENFTLNKHSYPRPGPVEVSLEIMIQEITTILESSNEVEMDIYINEYWNDKRLKYSHLNPCRRNMSVNYQVYDKIWSPNTGFINSKLVEIHQSPFKNMYMIIYQNGTVRVNYRVKVKAPCEMNLRSYPMDNLTCTLNYESFSYNIDHVRLRWSNISTTPVIMLNVISLAEFKLTSIGHDLKHNMYPGGDWDELRLIFDFQRQHVWYIVYIYVPTFLSVLIGWLGICLGVKATSARAILCVCSFISLIIVFGRLMSIVPHTSYLKAIDVWLLALLTFSAFTALELAIIGCFASEKSNRLPKVRHLMADSEEDSAPDTKSKRKRNKNAAAKESKRKESVYYNCSFFTLERMDKIAGYLLPTIFALFNIIYWSFYAPRLE